MTTIIISHIVNIDLCKDILCLGKPYQAISNMSLPLTPNQRLVPIGAAAKILGVSIDTIRRWEKKGTLTAVRPNGKDRFFAVEDLDKLKASKALTTAEAARHLGISPTTLRKLDKKGVIKTNRDKNGSRLFTPKALQEIDEQVVIPRLKLRINSGEYFSIPQIKPMLTSVEELLTMSNGEPEKRLTDQDLKEHAKEKISHSPDIELVAEEKIFDKLVHFKPVAFTILSGSLATIFLFALIMARTSNFHIFNQKQDLAQTLGASISSDVLAATSTQRFIDFNTDLIVEGDLAVGGSINLINLIPAGGDTAKNLTISAPSITLDQDLSTTSSPTFAGLTVLTPINAPSLSATTLKLPGTEKQIVFNSNGTATGTLSWTPTSAVTLTLPNVTDTLVTKTSTDTLSNKTINSGDGNTLSGSFTGITGLGTITTGTWNGSTIGATNGGTGLSSYTAGDLIYSSAANTLSKLTVGSSGQVLTVSSGLPAWASSSSILTSVASDILPATTNTYNLGSATNQWQNGWFGGTLTVNGNIVGASTGTSGYWTRDNTAGTLFTATTADKVGIGITAPASQLEVKAASTNGALILRAASSGTANIFDVMNNAGTTSYFSVDSTGSLSGSAFRITDQANAVVGTAIPGGWTLGSFTYTYRRPISITATGNLPINYEINVDINNTSTAGKIFNSTEQVTPWRDFRMAYTTDGVNFTEIRRNITTYSATQIVYSFQLKAQINTGTTSSTNYYIYYSSPNLSSMTQTAADLTYTGTLNLDSTDTDSTTGWTSGDGAYVLSAASSPAPQAGSNSLKTTAMVDRMGALSTTSQGQLAAGLTDVAALSVLIGSTTYVYAGGGNNGSDVSTLYKSAITSDNIVSFAATANQFPQTLSGATLANAISLDSGNGTTTLDLSLGSGAGGCTGTGLSWNAGTSTCTIDVSTSQQTFNYTNINVSSGTTLTINGPYTTANGTRFIPILKATGTVTIDGTVNLAGKGYGGGTSGHVAGYGPGAGGNGTGTGSGAGHAGAGGQSSTSVAGGSAYSDAQVGSGGGFGATPYNGGAGGGGIEIDAAGNITVSATGSINADGAAATVTGSAGGGSGGRINLSSSGNISVAGSVTANGGNGSWDTTNIIGGGGGSGGIITLQDIDGTVAGVSTPTGGCSEGSTHTCEGAPNRTGSAGTLTTTTVVPTLYIIGGKNGSNYQSTVYRTTLSATGDTTGNFVTTGQGQLTGHPVAGHTSFTKVTGGVTNIYVLGGNNGSTYYDAVYKSPIDGTGNITAFSTASQSQLPSVLSQHAQTTITIGGATYLYILGGKTSDTTYSSAVYKATVNASTGNIEGFTSSGQGVLPVALYGAQAVTATVGSLNYLFVIGGNNGTSNVSTVYRAPIDGSGNVGSFSAVGQTTLSPALSGHKTISYVDGVTPYFYTIGGTTGSPVSTVYKSTLTSDMTNFYIYKQISATGYDLSNKNDLTFSFYSTDNTASLEQVAFSESASPTFTSDTGWSTSTFAAAAINTWEPIDWDISGIGSRTSVKWLRFKVNTPRTLTFDTYIDNLKIQTSASASTNTNTANPATLGAANLTLNAQGTGIVRANYSDNSSSTFPNLAGSGGFAVYDGSQDCSDGSHAVSCLLFSVGSTGNITATGTITGLTGITSSGTAAFTGTVGIGTTVPLSKLGVLGNVSIGATYGNVAAPTSGLIVEGKVGIGTTAPGSTFTVAGSVAIGTTYSTIVAPANSLIVGGNVGIGTTNPVHTIDVVGDAGLSTGTLWTNTSDARVKLNIETIPDALRLVNQLKPSQYMYTPEYLARHPEIKNVEHYGFIAQDFQQVFPESITTGPDGFLQVNASNVIPYMTKAIQELLAKFENHDTRIQNLEDKLASISGTLQSSNSGVLASATSQKDINELNLTPPDLLIATTSANLLDLTVRSDATFSGQLSAYATTVSATFKSLGETFLGNTMVAGNFIVDGTLSLTGDSINTLTDLHIQNGPMAGNIDFFNGKIIMDNLGNIYMGGNLELEGAVTIKARAGENLATGEAVYISADGTVSRADSTVRSKLQLIGITASDALRNTEVKIAINGKIKGFSNLVAGKKYYLGSYGQITPTPPINAMKNIQAGVAFSPTELLIQIFDFNGLIN